MRTYEVINFMEKRSYLALSNGVVFWSKVESRKDFLYSKLGFKYQDKVSGIKQKNGHKDINSTKDYELLFAHFS